MATTDAVRARASFAGRTNAPGGPPAVRLGVQSGYPFSLVRRLTLVFICVLAFCSAGAWMLMQSVDASVILLHWIPVALAILISLYVAELIGVTERPLPPLTMETLFWAIATSCLVMALGYAVVPTYPPSTWLVCAAPIVSAVSIYMQRKWVEQRGENESVSTLMLAGSREEASRGLAELAQAPDIEVKAILLPESEPDRAPMAGVRIHKFDRTLDLVRSIQARLLVVANPRAEDLKNVLAPCAGAGCMIERVDDLIARMQGRVNLSTSDQIEMVGRLTNRTHQFPFQRVIDVLFTLLLAPFALIVGTAVAIAIKLTSKGPVLFTQTRTGRWGRDFAIVKFRTMRVDAEKDSGPVFTQQDDPRITKFGQFLRSTRLDELPQLWNVLKGDMSLVGPRPERPYFVRTLGHKIPFYDARHAVRPGVTGWAQIRYRYGADDDDARNKLAYELFYILNRSLVFYFAVLLETIKVVLFQRGSR